MDDPSNWTILTDDKTGREYYYNKLDKSTTWSKPACLGSAKPPGGGGGGTFAPGGSTFAGANTFAKGTGTFAGTSTFASTFATGTMGLQTGLRSDLQTFNMTGGTKTSTTMGGSKIGGSTGPSRALPTDLI
eukprot:GFYU01028069.1.p2 GENE.GFYU01028069.1~~GFYU01028069.1.p2  ORF type:complete len:131 (+),score=26.67 GFYU01028069.1:94-486(+)